MYSFDFQSCRHAKPTHFPVITFFKPAGHQWNYFVSLLGPNEMIFHLVWISCSSKWNWNWSEMYKVSTTGTSANIYIFFPFKVIANWHSRLHTRTISEDLSSSCFQTLFEDNGAPWKSEGLMLIELKWRVVDYRFIGLKLVLMMYRAKIVKSHVSDPTLFPVVLDDYKMTN